jgi:hypothetical protein
MMKRFLVVLGGVFLALIVFGAIGFGILFYQGGDLDSESKAYVEATVPPILASWSVEKLKEASSAQMLNALESKSVSTEQFFEKLSMKLGALRKFHDVVGEANILVTPQDGKTVTANYTAKADFEGGPATIKIRLIQMNEQWKLLYLNINSDALLK